MTLKPYFSAFLDILFPVSCVGCDGVLEQGEEDICSVCRVDLPKTNLHVTSQSNAVVEKFYGLVPITHGFSYLFFKRQGIVQRLLHQLKYNNQPQIGELVGTWYGAELQEAGLDKAFDLLIPVPLHPTKQQTRGYNQSEYFAKGIASVWGIPLLTDLLQKTAHTESQTKKTRTERIENVQDGFFITDPKLVAGKRVLILDDVITTGATLITCAEIVLKNKAQQVSVATIALAQS